MTEIERIIQDVLKSTAMSDDWDNQLAKAIEQYVDQKIKIVQEDWEEEYRALEQEVIKARIEGMERGNRIPKDLKDSEVAELKKGLDNV